MMGNRKRKNNNEMVSLEVIVRKWKEEKKKS